LTIRNRFEHAGHALRIELAGQERLVPRGGHKRHRREVVELVGLHVLNRPDQRQLIQQVGRAKRHAIEQVFDPAVILVAQPADDTGDLVALLEQQLG